MRRLSLKSTLFGVDPKSPARRGTKKAAPELGNRYFTMAVQVGIEPTTK